ncbi:MAG: hypothetical protein RLZZ175_2327 [Bacteroidota bacterium]|jgi:protein-L-isoaspartate(D-aspartate) O-methyltransferase
MTVTFEDNFKHKGLRNALIKELKIKGITSPTVLEAINKVPRHLFLESAFLNHAYEDKAFPIGDGQTISQPYTVALQTSLLDVKKGDKVLEIGTGSGYQSCVLLELDVELHSIETVKPLLDRTLKLLDTLNRSESLRLSKKYVANFYYGDGTLGLPHIAPFDKIIVTAGAPVIPESLVSQLKVGGILVIPVGDSKSQEMLKITKISNKEIKKEILGKCAFVPLIGKEGW